MIACQQKYCKNCINPVFDTEDNFTCGYCKISRYLVLKTNGDPKEYINYDNVPLLCPEFQPRKRRLKY